MRISDWSSDVCSSDLLVLENIAGDVRDRRDYEKVRRIAYGLVNGRLLVCVYTVRGTTYRIISVRKANSREQTKRSEARRGGNECASPCRSRGSPYTKKKNKKEN